MTKNLPIEDAHIIQTRLHALAPGYAATPLIALPELAAAHGLGAVFLKDEGARTLGSFKSLGGTYAALRALSRATGEDFAAIASGKVPAGRLPQLLTASAGNHGLAVAAAARFAGSRARIFLYPDVSRARRDRIVEMGAEIVDIDGTYDDAVDAAKKAAKDGAGILVADTSSDPDDPIVSDVIAGYGVIPQEIKEQIGEGLRPTHLFIQAGVGGLAAAMTTGLKDWLAQPARIVVVEPATAACVDVAIRTGNVERVPGDLTTSATMLACGEASRPALKLMAGLVDVVTVEEDRLLSEPLLLEAAGGPATTPSGAAGLAGLRRAIANPEMAVRLELDASSRVLLFVTEGPLNEET
jgi:diaminopropionate ammonia-lyase